VDVPQLQVLGTVVMLQIVEVMHGLPSAERPAQHLGHDPDMLGDPATLRLGVGVLGVGASDPDIAFRVDPASLAAEPFQGLTTLSLGGMTAAETAGLVLPGAARERAVLELPAVGAQERRKLLAAGELVEVARAQPAGAVLVGAVVEGADPPEHVFDPTASPGSRRLSIHSPTRHFGMIWPHARVAQHG
jgi:hypothetical protein